MRPRSLLTPLLTVIFLSFFLLFIYKLYIFTRIFYSHSGPSFTQEEVLRQWEISRNLTSEGEGGGGGGLVPKIIHHVFHNWKDPGDDSLPDDWEEVRESCVRVNKGWEFMLWTESSSREFINAHYPWFLKTYDGYRYPIQRIDTIRYFILRHYGGIYLDLDNGCKTPLIPLLKYPAFLTDGGRGALSNNILGGARNHPFWVQVTDSLVRYDYNYLFPYVTVSFASGQWFITSIFENYYYSLRAESKSELGFMGGNFGGIGDGGGGLGDGGKAVGEVDVVRIMMDTRLEHEEGNGKWVFFTQGRGGTWIGWDNAFFSWLGDFRLWVLVIVALVCGLGWWVMRRRRLGGGSSGSGYVKVERDEEGV